MSDEEIDRKVEQAIDKMTSKSRRESFARIGYDVDNPQQMAELQELIVFMRTLKNQSDTEGLVQFLVSLKKFSDKGKLAFAAAIGAGIAAALWASITGYFSG